MFHKHTFIFFLHLLHVSPIAGHLFHVYYHMYHMIVSSMCVIYSMYDFCDLYLSFGFLVRRVHYLVSALRPTPFPISVLLCSLLHDKY